MSLIKLNNMANEIGLQGQFAFYCNRGRGVVNDSNGLVLIQTDIDAMNLAKFVDKNRMVGVFIDHQNGLQNESVGEVLQELPNGVEERTVEPVGVDVTNLDCPVFEGVFERADGMDVEEVDGVGVEDVEELVYVESHVHSEREHSTESLDIIDDRVNIDSESEQSMGSDSDFSEKLVDSDFEISDDDSMFDQNIDPEAELGGGGYLKVGMQVYKS
ncbi:hypothetical protein BUALT_Bualt18G0021900 [Buddleja alternifolia]|uniref:Uncharacterized protein n=1 Tax=Buddleja alternifolia TaxID=168488 RepID=A0AAV6W324_9LAMI|nr:hypothetical protein BUALT_Bualt18G0021900 [Buddleja alternifolia]